MNFNQAIVLGNVTFDPVLRKTPAGQSITSFGVATNRSWTDKAGQKQESAEFHNVVAWGKLAELSNSYLTKGSLVLVEGRLQTRSWEDKNGVKRSVTEIVAEGIQFGPKPNAPKPETTAAAPAPREEAPSLDDEEGTQRAMKPMFSEEEEIRPEDIPF